MALQILPAGNGTQLVTSSKPYTLTGLMANTDYDWYVRAICSIGDSSNWSGVASFKTATAPSCSQPSALSDSKNTINSVELAWTENGTATQWEVGYNIVGSSSNSQLIVNSKPFTLNSLTSGTDYEWYVRAICPAGNTSAWSDTALFSTLTAPVCSIPSSPLVSSVSAGSADLSWTENGTATQWEVSYGSSGFTAGNGSQVVVNSKSFNLTGLMAGTSYDWYVRGNLCGRK